MRLIALYIVFIMFITVIIPAALIQSCELLDGKDIEIEKIDKIGEISKIEDKVIPIYNTATKQIEEMKMEEYLKGVVAAEMPAAFHIEALKAQAVAARTYSMDRIIKYEKGHPDHPKAALCTGIHCQAYLSEEQLRASHDKNWMYEYWPKIEEAVESTKGQIMTYNGKPIEALFHSTSGGMTENSEEVFASKQPYLRAVESPYEQGAPRLTGQLQLSIDQFIRKLQDKYPNIILTKQNLANKINLVQRSTSGRVKELKIDNKIVSGRDIRSVFGLDSTNFTISVNINKDVVLINTKGYGHGVGMSQWGAYGMAKKGSDYQEILKHYYSGVKIQKAY